MLAKKEPENNAKNKAKILAKRYTIW